MDISLACPSCSKTLSFPTDHFGKKVQCPHCGKPLRLPDEETYAATLFFKTRETGTRDPEEPKPEPEW